jgi:helix-turn-helix protein
MVSSSVEAAELAARVRGLKERSERSYGALARRLNVSTSTLHRYCSGAAVPAEFTTLERLARLCGASDEERVELHRLWIVASSARRQRGDEVSDSPAEQPEQPGQPPPGPRPPRPWYRRGAGWRTTAVVAVALVLVALAALAIRHTGASSASSASSAAADPPPLTWTARSHVWEYGCSHAYLVDRPAREVPPPPVAQDAARWAGSLGAVHGGETLVRISVQGRSSAAVVLEELRVRVVGREAPLRRGVFLMQEGCGGALTPRQFDVDLDAGRPLARSRPGNDAGREIPAARFPYRVSASEPEVLEVNARTVGCDCRWYLELAWSSQGRSGSVRIDDHGRPFRTSAIDGLPRYVYGYGTRDEGWVRD